MWFKKSESEIKTGLKEKKFRLTPTVERDLLPLLSLEEQKAARMMWLRSHDKGIQKIQELIDKADRAVEREKKSKTIDPDTLDKHLAAKLRAEEQQLYLMLADKELNKLHEDVKKIYLDPKFYKPLIKHCYKVKDSVLDTMEALQVEKCTAFFLYNMRVRKKGLTVLGSS